MKTQEIERFLNAIHYGIENNKNVNSDTIYSFLVRCRNGDHSEINNFFPEWISYFKDRDNIKVFNSESWSYFCQFVNGDVKTKQIKLYIPLPRDKIFEGAKIIFDFLAQNNIHHSSKIGSHVRTDDIVIRVDSLRNAVNIINLVKNNKFLSNSLMENNPFVFNINGVGLTLDGHFSYNSELSKALFQYFALRKQQNITTKPNAQEFCRFMKVLENQTTSKEHRMIYKLIRQNADGTLDVNRFIDNINEYQENELLLDKAIDATRKKYGEKHVLAMLVKSSKDYFGNITNDNDCRREVTKYLSGAQIKRIINNRCGYNSEEITKDVALDYMSKIYTKMDIIEEKVSSLIYALMETARKHGFGDNADKLTLLLKMFIKNRQYNVFTRDNGARERVFVNIKEEDSIIDLLIKYLELEEPVVEMDVARVFVEREILKIDTKKK